MQYKHEYGVELEGLIGKIAAQEDGKLVRPFLFDLLSPAEYRDLAVRWQIIKMLKDKVSHRDIAKSLKVSVATINRGARELADKKGGFQTVLTKFYKSKNK